MLRRPLCQIFSSFLMIFSLVINILAGPCCWDGWFQASWTTTMKSSWCNHMFSNLNICGLGIFVLTDTRIVTWSVMSLGKVFAFVSENCNDHCCVIKHQSSFSWRARCCLFDHVKAWPLRGTDWIPSFLVASLNSNMSCKFPHGLFLFCGQRIRLKSPKNIHEMWTGMSNKENHYKKALLPSIV